MVPFYENRKIDLFYMLGNRLDFSAHLHNHIELVYMLEGKTITHVDGKKSILKKGDIFISFPNQVHQFISDGPELYHLFIFTPKLVKDMRHYFKNYIPDNNVITNAGSSPNLLTLLTYIANAYKSSYQYKELQIKGYLLAFFSELLNLLELKKINTTNLSTLQNIMIYCSENYTKELTLASISNDLHISKYYVSHLLKSKLDLGFSDYVNSLRISEACNLLLQDDMSITEISYQVGFNTIRTFNRAFNKFMGMTPTDFKK